MLSRAIEIAARAHAGQTDKAGKAYILHPLRVMMNVDDSEAAQICAVLHDAAEDTAVTLDYLQAEGFSEEIIAALECLTKRPGEEYDDFINRILPNPLACAVKTADLADNMDLSRISNPTQEDRARQSKYAKALFKISIHQPDKQRYYRLEDSGNLLMIQGVSVYSLDDYGNWLANQRAFCYFYDEPGIERELTKAEAFAVIEERKRSIQPPR